MIGESMKKILGASLAIALAASVTGGQVAFAESSSGDSASGAIENIAPEVIQDITSGATVGIDIPSSRSNDRIEFTQSEFNLSVELPETAVKYESSLGEGLADFWDLGDGAVMSPLAKEDGSLQILTVIESADASTRYEYNFDALGQFLLKQSGDGVIIESESGDFIAGIAPAWAKDSKGVPVPTHYEINGTKLIQVVEHTGSDFAYPIVADPWLGIALYGAISLNYYSYGYKINLTPTSWGIANSGAAQWWAHVDEIKSRLGGNAWRWTNSIQEQLYCHLAGIPASLPQYNLESWRPTVNWATSLVSYQCNP
jgi:hypothetical protein